MNEKNVGSKGNKPMHRRRGETKRLQPLQPEDEIEFFEKTVYVSRQLEEILSHLFPEQRENTAGKEKERGGR